MPMPNHSSRPVGIDAPPLVIYVGGHPALTPLLIAAESVSRCSVQVKARRPHSCGAVAMVPAPPILVLLCHSVLSSVAALPAPR